MSPSPRLRSSASWFIGAALIGALVGSRACARATVVHQDDVDRAAHTYLQLVAALTDRDPDSASGDTAVPSDTAVRQATTMSLSAISVRAREVADTLRLVDASTTPGITTRRTEPETQVTAVRAVQRSVPRTDEPSVREQDAIDFDASRRAWLVAQLDAVAARAAQLSGQHVTLKEELRQLFGIERLDPPVDDLSSIRARIDRLLPGDGSAAARLEAFDARATVSPDALPQVFARALDECRARTKAHVAMPNDERVTVQFVTGKPWSGFSTYVGQGRSVIMVNTSYPLTVDRVLQLACHEGYPGHHLLNAERDERRVAGRPELGAVPLFSPEAFATEMAAVAAVSRVFTDQERMRFERDVLFPLAGLPADEADAHTIVAGLVEQLAPAIGRVLHRYLAGERDYIETTWALQTDALMQHPQATIFFANQYRGLAFAYTSSAVTRPARSAAMLARSGFPGEPVIISSNGDNSSAGSQGR